MYTLTVLHKQTVVKWVVHFSDVSFYVVFKHTSHSESMILCTCTMYVFDNVDVKLFFVAFLHAFRYMNWLVTLTLLITDFVKQLLF